MNREILDKIIMVGNTYSDYAIACDKVEKEAKKHIDWCDRVSCEYYPGYGVCIEIEENVCDAITFFDLVEDSENGMIDESTYQTNLIQSRTEVN